MNKMAWRQSTNNYKNRNSCSISSQPFKGGTNVKAVDARIEKMGELQTKMHKAHVHAKLDAQKILTPEQLKKHQEMKGKREMHMREKGR